MMQLGKQPYTLSMRTSARAQSGRAFSSRAKKRFIPRCVVKSGSV